jgi:hypothetical protein
VHLRGSAFADRFSVSADIPRLKTDVSQFTHSPMKYVAPQVGSKSFTCPHCGVLARQFSYSNKATLDGSNSYSSNDPVATTICEHCEYFALWHYSTMVHPNRGTAPLPNPDMPADVKADYEEAATVATLSPRGAAALLRLAIQKLCKHLGGSGRNINDDISLLVSHGLPATVQKSLDVVRVIGNNAVHPGQIDADDPEIVGHLFSLINITTETMISVPNKINSLYGSLPSGALQAIQKRDKKP